MRVYRYLLVGLVGVLGALAFATAAGANTGQVFFGQASVEPAVNLADGSTIYLLTPNKAPLNSKANPVATAPLYIAMYPDSSTIDPTTLNCQPTTCDHVPVVPQGAIDYLDSVNSAWDLADVYPSTTVTSPFSYVGTQTGGGYEGHDHLVGIPPTGDFNVAWHVYLLLFTEKAVLDGAVNTRLGTLDDINAAIANGDIVNVMPDKGPDNPTGAVGVDAGIVFNCSLVSAQVYTQHTQTGG